MSRQLVIRSCLVIWSFIHVTSFGNPSMSRHLVIHSCLVIRSSIHVSSFGHPSMSRQLAIHPCLVIWSSIHVSSFGHPSMSRHPSFGQLGTIFLYMYCIPIYLYPKAQYTWRTCIICQLTFSLLPEKKITLSIL